MNHFTRPGGRAFVLSIFGRVREVGGGAILILYNRKGLRSSVGTGAGTLNLRGSIVFANVVSADMLCRTLSLFLFPSL